MVCAILRQFFIHSSEKIILGGKGVLVNAKLNHFNLQTFYLSYSYIIVYTAPKFSNFIAVSKGTIIYFV